ncbi:MAG: aromatic ring-hydroxylating dioxygenase subunit alpha [Alphaproteobacteria bacterium]|nr:aromatic ring-hydroxylating dioxygenase subunit alpha [Alphaproteobacteria bacterium]
MRKSVKDRSRATAGSTLVAPIAVSRSCAGSCAKGSKRSSEARTRKDCSGTGRSRRSTPTRPSAVHHAVRLRRKTARSFAASRTTFIEKRWRRDREHGPNDDHYRPLPVEKRVSSARREGSLMGAQHFLTETYGGYRIAKQPAIDEDLTRVGPRTPAGELLRRYWQPILHSADLKDLPVPVRILGEDLVAFRTLGGEVGLLERHCSHRGASLEYGKITENGIRCCYHAWHFAPDGRLIEAPTEPAQNLYAGKLCQGAYPTREFAGLVFAYLGPPERKPIFPLYDSLARKDFHFGLGEPDGNKINIQPTNWLQMMDNTPDQAHEAFLHCMHSGPQFLDQNGRPITELAIIGELDWWETPAGLACHEARRVGPDVWVRSMELLFPNSVQVCRPPVFPPIYPPEKNRIEYPPFLIRWKVPIDDTHTANYSIIFYFHDEPADYFTKPTPAAKALYSNRTYEEMQRSPGDFEAQIGQGPIAIQAREHLGRTDRGLAMMRKMLRDNIEAVRRGDDPKNVVRTANGPIPTYSREMMIRVPMANDPETDKSLLRQLSKQTLDLSFAAAGR